MTSPLSAAAAAQTALAKLSPEGFDFDWERLPEFLAGAGCAAVFVALASLL